MAGHKQIVIGAIGALLLLIVVAAIIGSSMTGNNNANPIDINSPDVTGQSGGSSDLPGAVETETPDTKNVRPNSPAVAVEDKTPSETRTPNLDDFWYEVGDTEEDAKPAPTKTAGCLDYDPEDIGVIGWGYYSVDKKVFGPALALDRDHIKGIPAGSVILSNIKIDEARVEFCIENTCKYPLTTSSFIIGLEIETVHLTTGKTVRLPLDCIYKIEGMKLESGGKEKVVIEEDYIRSLITKGCPLKIVGIKVDTR